MSSYTTHVGDKNEELSCGTFWDINPLNYPSSSKLVAQSTSTNRETLPLKRWSLGWLCGGGGTDP